MAKILVTGGAGFIGSHVVDVLLDGGHEVHVVDNLSTGSLDNLSLAARFHQGDIRDVSTLEIIRGIDPEIVVHCAAQMSVRLSMEDPRYDTDVNVLGLVNMLQLWTGGSPPYFVFLSSGGAVYGEQEEFPAPETHPTVPMSVYGLAKRVGELYLDLWHRQFKFHYSSLRLANVYGPRQSPHGEAGVVAIFAEKLTRGESPVVNGTGEQTRDFVYVKDVAQAVNLVINAKPGGIFNIGTGKETSVNDLYRRIATLLDVGVGPTHGEPKAGEQLRSVVDFTHAQKSLGWYPSVSLDEGLSETVDWMKEVVERKK